MKRRVSDTLFLCVYVAVVLGILAYPLVQLFVIIDTCGLRGLFVQCRLLP